MLIFLQLFAMLCMPARSFNSNHTLVYYARDTSHIVYTTEPGHSNQVEIYPGEKREHDLEFLVKDMGGSLVLANSLQVVSLQKDLLGKGPDQIQIITEVSGSKKPHSGNGNFIRYKLHISAGKEVLPGDYTFWTTLDKDLTNPT
ncbi:MAG: hypothetical protein KGM98_03590, partial [Bacteroidota bacterium]|nr:hypothetical protein [Bacteroidota bacterium]